MKIKIVEGDKGSELFFSERTQVAMLEIPEFFGSEDAVVRRARELVVKTGSKEMVVSFELALKHRLVAKRG